MKEESDAARMLRKQREWQANKRAEERDAAAAAGVPLKKRGWRWWQIALAIIVGLMVLGALLPDTSKDKPAASSGSEAATPESTDKDAVSAASPPSKWTYGNSKDEMRGTESRQANITSENQIKLDSRTVSRVAR